jgi:nicotinamidase-related amidase
LKTALLIIDVQEGLFSPTRNPFDSDAVIARINRPADRARTRDGHFPGNSTSMLFPLPA